MTDLHWILIAVAFLMIFTVACMVKVAKAYDEAFAEDITDDPGSWDGPERGEGLPPSAPEWMPALKSADVTLCKSKGLKDGKA